MAKGKKTGGRDFVPGDPRAGRPAMPDDVRAARKFTSAEVQRVLTEYMHMTGAELAARVADPGATMLEKFIASIMTAGIDEGDHSRLNFLFDRTVGKVKEQLEVSQPKPFVIQHTSGAQTILGAEVKKIEGDE